MKKKLIKYTQYSYFGFRVKVYDNSKTLVIVNKKGITTKFKDLKEYEKKAIIPLVRYIEEDLSKSFDLMNS